MHANISSSRRAGCMDTGLGLMSGNSVSRRREVQGDVHRILRPQHDHAWVTGRKLPCHDTAFMRSHGIRYMSAWHFMLGLRVGWTMPEHVASAFGIRFTKAAHEHTSRLPGNLGWKQGIPAQRSLAAAWYVVNQRSASNMPDRMRD